MLITFKCRAERCALESAYSANSLSLIVIFIRMRVFSVFVVRQNRDRVKRVQVTFTEEQWSLVESFRGIMGNEDAEIVRNIVLAWLAEKSLISEDVKGRMRRQDGG